MVSSDAIKNSLVPILQRHGAKWTDVGAARIARWHQANGSHSGGADDAKKLPEELPPVPIPNSPLKHAQVRNDMPLGGSLTENVRILQVREGLFWLPLGHPCLGL